MARRHSSLVPLSHDHHHGLALALRLRQGREALLNDGWTHDRFEQARRVADFYARELVPHFHAEEAVLFPAMRSLVPSSQSLIGDLEQQHREIARLVVNVAKEKDPAALDAILTALGTILEGHIRTEERSLFPLYEESVTEDEKARVGRDMELLERAAHGSSPEGRDANR